MKRFWKLPWMNWIFLYKKRNGEIMEFNHKSVLLWETVDGLAVKPDGVYVVLSLVQAEGL